jgi:ABC-type transport system involved in multi-copper enzyme maturation permease subunit
MLFGPITTLEMITAARRARYFIVRVLYAGVLLALLWTNYMETLGSKYRVRGGQYVETDGTATIGEVASFSRAFFGTFAWAQIGAVLLLTPAMMAGSIAQERERRTIEYMFASMLTNGEIVMSKFLARTIHVGSLLLVGLPLLAIAMLLGGIDPALLLIVFVVTIATLAATASLSIAVSVWAKRSRDAVVRTFVFLLAFLILPPILWLLQGYVWPWLEWLTELGRLLTAVNPFAVLIDLFSGRPSVGVAFSPWRPVWPLVASYFCFSALALVWSIVSLRRVYRKSVGAGDAAPKWARMRRRWRPALRTRPMLWKELFAATAMLQLGVAGRIAVALLFIASMVPGAIIAYNFNSFGGRRGVEEFALGQMMAVTLLECGALLVVAIRAAGSVTAEKERDTWTSLTSTPLGPAEIVWAKIAGSIYAARWFFLPIGLWWALVALFFPAFLVITPMQLATFAAIALAVSATGVWFSSWCRTSIRSMASTVALAVFLGGGYLMCCLPLFAGSGRDAEFSLVACIPFLLAAPTVFWVESLQGQGLGPNDVEMIVIYILGSAGYLLMGVVMAAINVNGFEERLGRPMRSVPDWPFGAPLPPRPAAPPAETTAPVLAPATASDPAAAAPRARIEAPNDSA